MQPRRKSNFSGYEKDPLGYINEILKVRLTPDQERITTALMEKKRVMVLSCHSSGKCKHQDDWVYLADGSRVQAKRLVGKKFKTLTTTPSGLVEVDAFADWNKIEDTYEVITESGRKLTVNRMHPLWAAIESRLESGYVLNPRGWTPVKNLRRGDLIAVTKEFPAFGQNNIDDKSLVLLAHLLTNSYAEDNTILLINKSIEQFREFDGLVSDLGTSLIETDQENRYILKDSTVVEDMYVHYNISDSFRHRRIPEEIFTLSKDKLIIFLKAVFRSNVLLIKNENEAKLKFYHRSETFIRDLSFLFLKFGISAKVYRKDDKDFWVLRVLNVEEFVEVFGEGTKLDFLIQGHPDTRLNWRFKNVPNGTFWEKIKEINFVGQEQTVAIEVPEHHCYLTDVFEHNSYLGGALANWNYDAHPQSITLTAGPNEDVVRDTIWRELREHRNKIPDDMWDKKELLPKESRMESDQSHFVTGFLAGKGAGARGRKSPWFLMVFEEADGIQDFMWTSARGMLIDPRAMWLAVMNPIDVTSRAHYEYENDSTWEKIHISALNHPNVISDLITGDFDKRPFPIDLNANWVTEQIVGGCREIETSSRKSFDIEWPPKIVNYRGEKIELSTEPRYWRPEPGSEVEPRVLGQWPSNTNIALWNTAMWLACLEPRPLDTSSPVEIGCDPAGMGKDATSIVVRRGITALHHEKQYGWNTYQIAEHLKYLADFYGKQAGMTPETVPVRVDNTGNTGVFDQRGNFNFIAVNSATNAIQKDKYPNRRSELWFETREKGAALIPAADGEYTTLIDVSRLAKESQATIKRQLQAARFFLRAGGKKEVEKKEDMSRRLKESPDDADAFNLAFSDEIDTGTKTVITPQAARAINQRFGRRYRR